MERSAVPPRTPTRRRLPRRAARAEATLLMPARPSARRCRKRFLSRDVRDRARPRRSAHRRNVCHAAFGVRSTTTASHYAVVGAAALTLKGGTTSARIALTGVGDLAFRASAVEAALSGSGPTTHRPCCRVRWNCGRRRAAVRHVAPHGRSAMADVAARAPSSGGDALMLRASPVCSDDPSALGERIVRPSGVYRASGRPKRTSPVRRPTAPWPERSV